MYQANNGPRPALAVTSSIADAPAMGRARQDVATGVEMASPVPYVTAGSTLIPGEVYIDLAQPCRGPFRALHGQMAGSRNRYVPRRAISDKLWNQIVEQCARIGVLPSSRLGF